jgi:DeoR/GlpR family transcriptional regulator of sugar metabolism
MGFNLDEGLTTTDPGEAFTKQLVMQRAHTVVLLAHSAKAGTTSFAHAGRLEDIDVFISDQGLDPDFKQQLEQRDIRVLTV